ncbi:MAG: hypothetical protein IPP90_10650 [Gemmatimonadaceae bacterium]|nr:hypothetical protein [Gemmatimonadaceae bacterium]
MSEKQPEHGPSDVWGPLGPVIQPLLGTWIQAARIVGNSLSAVVPGGAAAMNQFATAMSGGPRTLDARQSVQVSSRAPATVTVALDPDAEYMLLTVDPLSPAKDADALPLLGVAIACREGHVTVSVTVPDDQPPGVYEGEIKDGGGNRRGQVTVQLASLVG